MRVLITTVPFAEYDTSPLEILSTNSVDFTLNPIGRKLTEDEIASIIPDYDILIAGTEPITSKVIGAASRLKFISRVGVGLDSVDLIAARKRGIRVSYTAEAPAPAVSDLTIGLIITLLRGMHISNIQMHRAHWRRTFGRRLEEATVGVIGVGRIGKRVCKALLALGCGRILCNDLNRLDFSDDLWIDRSYRIEFVEKSEIYERADVLTLHVPLTNATRGMIGAAELQSMKPSATLINTSRGGVVDERALTDALQNGVISGAALDVFETEPYHGDLSKLENCMLTAHMGSMTIDCRTAMEIQATLEAVRFLQGQSLHNEVPDSEYQVQYS